MKGEGFIEFIYYDESLKQEERFKYLIQKYRENVDDIKLSKEAKLKEINSFIGVLDILETEVREFKKLLPTSSEDIGVEEIPERKVPVTAARKVVPVKKSPAKKATHAKVIPAKKAVKKHVPVKKAGKNLGELRLGLQKIRDELGRI